MSKANSSNGNTKTKEKAQETQRTDIGLSGEAVENVVSLLTQALSDIQVLYVKTLNVHWNIVDPSFYGIHILLDDQYNALKQDGDKVAERIRGYGVPVIGSMGEFLENSRLKEKIGGQTVGIEALGELVADHEAVIRQLRKDIDSCDEEYGDQGAADLLTAQMQKHQDMAWMLRSFLPKS
ncbi:MAG: DNA starvation/stationary phase protection protein [Caldilineaceae bacterium]|nr:DNA starvation/stationary phase protection protein [Caldilineaceae bacterium]